MRAADNASWLGVIVVASLLIVLVVLARPVAWLWRWFVTCLDASGWLGVLLASALLAACLAKIYGLAA